MPPVFAREDAAGLRPRHERRSAIEEEEEQVRTCLAKMVPNIPRANGRRRVLRKRNRYTLHFPDESGARNERVLLSTRQRNTLRRQKVRWQVEHP